MSFPNKVDYRNPEKLSELDQTIEAILYLLKEENAVLKRGFKAYKLSKYVNGMKLSKCVNGMKSLQLAVHLEYLVENKILKKSTGVNIKSYTFTSQEESPEELLRLHSLICNKDLHYDHHF